MRLTIVKFTRSLLLAISLMLPLAAAITQPVRVEGGMVVGKPGSDPKIVAFKGIPFAAPPVGNLRWKAPAPIVAWPDVRKAEEFGNSCVQNTAKERKPWTYEFMTHNQVSEDCLYLNVWTPAKTAIAKRPVYVFFYGGGNVEGSAAVPVYDGEGLAKKGIVVVTVNYRLGVLGFFTHPELTRESGAAKSSGNYALLDLIAALRWVQSNITAFGGDPHRVTIGGQSAGASNVHSLVASPLAKGLFHGAIAESGSSVTGLGLMNARKLADQEELGVKFAAAKGAKSLADLRRMSAKDLIAPVPAPAQPFRFSTVVDGYVMPAPAGEIFAQGKQNDVPTLTGCNRDEGGAVPHPDITLEAYRKQANQRYGSLASEFLQLYPATSATQAGAAQNESSRDAARTSMYLWAKQRDKTAKTKAYTYFWDHALPGPEVEKYGAFHTSEVPYVMNTLYMSDRPFTDADRRIADMMSSYWANFISKGSPNGKDLPRWHSVGSEAVTMQLGDRTQAIPVAGDKSKLAFFEKFLLK